MNRTIEGATSILVAFFLLVSLLLQVDPQKQDMQGRWLLEYDYTGKTWCEFGAKRQPNKWVTLRALRVLKAVAQTVEVAQNRHIAAA